jgi:hypothetical protein
VKVSIMSEQEIFLPPPQPRRQDARDLLSRLYREIGIAAVEAALFVPESGEDDRSRTRGDRPATNTFSKSVAA